MDKLPAKSEASLKYEMEVTRPGRSKPANLRDQVMNMGNWPTPCARDWKDSGAREMMQRQFDKRNSPSLALTVGKETGGRLNPDWVEWLMCWPIGWSDNKPMNPKEFQYWKDNLLTFSHQERTIGEIIPRTQQQPDKMNKYRLIAIGNGQVPLQAACAWWILEQIERDVTITQPKDLTEWLI